MTYIPPIKDISGNVKSNDPLVAFLYNLMRDHLPTGVVAEIMKAALDNKEDNPTYVFSNGWLAQYCIYIAMQIEIARASNAKL
jgi:hypothetical protein